MIAKNIDTIRDKIAVKCSEIGRNPNDIKLIAVSKLHGISEINDAFRSGIKDFGENKAQELTDKAPNISFDIKWHFIGHLQTNKAKYVVKHADYIHSVDSVKLAKEINKRAEKFGKVQKVLLEINTSGELAKYGLENESEILETAEFCKEKNNIDLKGLMTMAPYVADEQVVRNCFRNLNEIKLFLNEKGFGLTELSMGMTNDFEIGIEEGATMLRIGTAIFGERDYSKN